MRVISFILFCIGLSCFAQTDAYIKIHDSHNRHPRAVSIEFPGNTIFPADYDALYGHGAVLEIPGLLSESTWTLVRASTST